jgi:hypothetical protein
VSHRYRQNGFANPIIPPEKPPRTDVKCILVERQLYSEPGLVAKDEPLARRPLEEMDFAALAKFLTRVQDRVSWGAS